jgi:hypothetical protein
VDGKTVIRWNTNLSTANATVNGIVGGPEGRVIYLYNDDPTYNLIITHESGSATATDRVFFSSAGNLTLTPGQMSGPLIYVDSRWRSPQ